MNAYVIGDIHGCYHEFKRLLGRIKPDLTTERLILLGDYIDRGTQSWEVVKEIISLLEMFGRDHVVPLRGNHEQMAIDYILCKGKSFLYNGGKETIKSFARHGDYLGDYLEFFTSMPLYVEDEKFIYVHGGIRQGVSLSNQSSEDMLWLRDEFYEYPNTTDKTVIFGHTPTYYINKTDQPAEIFNNYALDTGCVFGGYLSAAQICNGKIARVYQVEKKIAS
ncbi:metallophosphoesterase family protein [Desulfitobacterium sp. THU1]|uniref:metallophosphoesterase family protein n=1 Tax=Desulfitobacterium sp. THU1 TaxID=3138072 RepID=UPI00312045DF